MKASRSNREQGSATVLTVAAIGVVVTMTAAALVVSSIVRDVHRARGAADLAALAAALPLAAGDPADCAAAERVASANGAALTACGVQAEAAVEVSVSISRPTSRRWIPLPGVVSASARAGVAEAESR